MQRLHPTVLSLVLVGSACSVDRIVHEQSGSGAEGEAGGADDGEAERGGNFPEPALTVCGALPPGVTAIEGLTSAYAVIGPRAYYGEEPGVGDPEALRIRLASWGIEAGDTLLAPVGDGELVDPPCGESGWSFGFDVPVEHIAVGVHALAEIPPAYPEQHYAEVIINDATCSGGGEVGEDGGADSILDMGGELEIFAVTETCVIGELRNVHNDATPEILHNGGFVAQRMALPCVPQGTATCD